jgi:hypothetical protein
VTQYKREYIVTPDLNRNCIASYDKVKNKAKQYVGLCRQAEENEGHVGKNSIAYESSVEFSKENSSGDGNMLGTNSAPISAIPNYIRFRNILTLITYNILFYRVTASILLLQKWWLND